MREKRMTVTNKRLVEILTTAMEKPEIANALIQRVINTLNRQVEREWQGLTDDEILEEYRQSYGDDGDLTDVYFARAIEAKLKEKNSA